MTTTATRGGGRPGRGYYSEDGKTRFPAVTTVAGRFDDKQRLVQAANNVGLEGKTLEEAWYGARGIGHEVHAMGEAYLHGEPVPSPSTLEATNGFESFVEWWEAGKFTVLHTELPIVSETMRFGGTIDTILRDSKGRLCLGDWKTSSGIFPGYLVQVAAYGLLYEEWSGEKLEGGYHLARFSKDHGDFEHRHYAELDDAARLFLIYREAYDIDKLVQRRAR
jgi:hypothetical protein